MNFKRFSTSDNQWHDIPYYQHKTATDTLTLPATLYPNDTSITVGIKGNMQQSGTPSPTTPIQPSECGERTGNLFDEKYPSISPTIQYMPMFVGDGTFTLSSTTPQMPNGAACLFLIAGNVSSGAGPQNKVYNEQSITVDSSNGYITIAYRIVSDYDPRNYTTMLNTGSPSLPYEPYGYKLPISSADTTTPIYLGEVETTRKVKKLVLTGNETGWTKNDSIAQSNAYYRSVSGYYRYNGLCSHYATVDDVRAETGVFFGGNINFLTTLSDEIDTVDKWKTYLQQQYDNGTPVCVWYVLATPETAVVNEPIRKIGTYADEVSGITIPVTAGGDTISVDTTVQPSEVTVNYKGWHPVADVHERENGAWN